VVQNACKPALFCLQLPSATSSPTLPMVSEWYQESDAYSLTVGQMACRRALHRHAPGRGGWSLRSLSAVKTLKFATVGRQIKCLPLPPVRRRRPHLASSLGPCATPPPILPLPFLCAQLKFERQSRRGSRGPLECLLLRVTSALLPTAAPPVPLLLLPQPFTQSPPRRSGLAGSFRYPMRGRGFLCRDQKPCPERFGAGRSTPGCKDQERRLLWLQAPLAAFTVSCAIAISTEILAPRGVSAALLVHPHTFSSYRWFQGGVGYFAGAGASGHTVTFLSPCHCSAAIGL
jgi:hypothetical protein